MELIHFEHRKDSIITSGRESALNINRNVNAQSVYIGRGAARRHSQRWAKCEHALASQVIRFDIRLQIRKYSLYLFVVDRKLYLFCFVESNVTRRFAVWHIGLSFRFCFIWTCCTCKYVMYLLGAGATELTELYIMQATRGEVVSRRDRWRVGEGWGDTFAFRCPHYSRLNALSFKCMPLNKRVNPLNYVAECKWRRLAAVTVRPVPVSPTAPPGGAWRARTCSSQAEMWQRHHCESTV